MTRTAFYVTNLIPVIFIFLANAVSLFYITITMSATSNKYKQRPTPYRSRLRIITGLVALLGLTWFIGFSVTMAMTNVVLQYLFCILSSTQGLLIFIFHCFLKENVGKFWKKLLTGKTPTTVKREQTRRNQFPSSPNNQTRISAINMGLDLCLDAKIQAKLSPTLSTITTIHIQPREQSESTDDQEV